MLELILCSLITVLLDYLFRRHAQGKRWGDQITFFMMWYELRWGIIACLLFTVSLITVIFYDHPSNTNAGTYLRTIPLIPEGGGRVEHLFVKNGESVEAGDPLFSLLDTAQVAGVNIAESQIDQIASAFAQAEVQLEAAKATLVQAKSARPATPTVVTEPLYEGGLSQVMPGSKCIANAYTNNHELLESGDLGLGKTLFLHMLGTVGALHAVILRMQELLLPVQILVFAGH